MKDYTDYGSSTHREMAGLMIGSLIGSGCYRTVHKNLIDPDSVLKIEVEAGYFANVLEWQMWDHFRYGPYKKWFAPCLQISPNGVILIQKKTTPCTKGDLPKKVPSFFFDLKIENWGWLNNRVVCHDYGNVNFSGGTKLKNVKWN